MDVIMFLQRKLSGKLDGKCLKRKVAITGGVSTSVSLVVRSFFQGNCQRTPSEYYIWVVVSNMF